MLKVDCLLHHYWKISKKFIIYYTYHFFVNNRLENCVFFWKCNLISLFQRMTIKLYKTGLDVTFFRLHFHVMKLKVNTIFFVELIIRRSENWANIIHPWWYSFRYISGSFFTMEILQKGTESRSLKHPEVFNKYYQHKGMHSKLVTYEFMNSLLTAY